jgi:hypothetical protein
MRQVTACVRNAIPLKFLSVLVSKHSIPLLEWIIHFVIVCTQSICISFYMDDLQVYHMLRKILVFMSFCVSCT